MSIQAVNYEVEDMGRYFKSSKKKYKWTFMLDEKQHMLELEFSYLSGKRRLVLDGRVLHESMMLTSSFQYPFTLEGFALNVIQQGDAFELRINNKVFSHLYTQQKTQNEFVYEEKINTNNKTENNFYSEPPNFNTQFSNNSFQNNSQKINLNIKFENPKDVNTIQQKPTTTQQIKTSNAFGQPGAFEEFDQFSQVSKTANNPFGDSFSVSGFSSGSTAQTTQQQKKVDLLNLDDDVPQQEQQKQVVTQQPDSLFNLQQNQNPQTTQQTNLFDAFGTNWNQQQIPQQQIPQQQTQQQQQQLQQQNVFQQTNQISQAFDSFNQVGQVNTQQGFQNQQNQGFQNQQGFGQAFQQPPPPQQNLNILNLYGNQQPVVGNLAYSAFPQVQQQYNQPVPQSQPTPFDLFK